MWGDARPSDMDARFDILRSQLTSSGDKDVYTQPRNYLSISGGGSDGAFGTGLLKGWSEVKPKVGPVARTSIETLIRTQGMGDLYRIYLGAKRDDMPYRLAYIPGDFDLEPEEDFDPKYMRALFDLAFELSRDGYD
jgi:hypothetical protein